jgi:hypothetical protein
VSEKDAVANVCGTTAVVVRCLHVIFRWRKKRPMIEVLRIFSGQVGRT